MTTAFVLMDHLLPQPLADFARAYPGIEVEMVENAVLADLSSTSAAAAPQRGRRRRTWRCACPPSGWTPGRTRTRHDPMPRLRLARCARPAAGPDTCPGLIRAAPWVAFERDASGRIYDRWMREHLAHADVRLRVDIFNAKAAMLRTGIGVGVLPTFMQDKHPELVAVSEPIPELAAPVWMLTHPDLRRTARVRAFMQFVGDAIATRLAQRP